MWGPAEAEAEASFWKFMALLRFQKCEVLLLQIQHEQQELHLDFVSGNRPIKFMDLETNESIKLQPDEIQWAYKKWNLIATNNSTKNAFNWELTHSWPMSLNP